LQFNNKQQPSEFLKQNAIISYKESKCYTFVSIIMAIMYNKDKYTRLT